VRKRKRGSEEAEEEEEEEEPHLITSFGLTYLLESSYKTSISVRIHLLHFLEKTQLLARLLFLFVVLLTHPSNDDNISMREGLEWKGGKRKREVDIAEK
jgi:hypothetical protein